MEISKENLFGNINREFVKDLGLLSSFETRIILSQNQCITELKLKNIIEVKIKDSLYSLLTSVYQPLTQHLIVKIHNESHN